MGTLNALVKLLDGGSTNPRTKTAALSTLANITDHDVKHCNSLLTLRKIEFWLDQLNDAQPSEVKIAACNLVESLCKNVPSIRTKKIKEAGGIETLCQTLLNAAERNEEGKQKCCFVFS